MSDAVEEGRPGRGVLALPLLGALLLLLAVLSLGTGPVSIPPDRVVDLLLHGPGEAADESAAVIVRQLRPPRVLLAILVGASLGLCGAVNGT